MGLSSEPEARRPSGRVTKALTLLPTGSVRRRASWATRLAPGGGRAASLVEPMLRLGPQVFCHQATIREPRQELGGQLLVARPAVPGRGSGRQGQNLPTAH
jgi:hypothetical protein